MKIEQVPAPFNPVTITLESREEVGILAALLGPTNTERRVAAYRGQVKRYPVLFPGLDEGRLCNASRGFSDLYDRLYDVLNHK